MDYLTVKVIRKFRVLSYCFLAVRSVPVVKIVARLLQKGQNIRCIVESVSLCTRVVSSVSLKRGDHGRER